MFLLAAPTPERIDAFLADQRGRPFSYPEVGASRGRPPAGYTVDRNRVRLGSGAAAFDRAAHALRSWRMCALGWCTIYPAGAPIEPGVTVAVVVRHLGFWSLNATRIVYVLDGEGGGVHRFGFAYGTLPAHAEVGEERFSVEWHRADDSVWYDVCAFSRPGHLLSRLGYPFGRMLQKRFARGSKRAMAAAVQGGGGAGQPPQA